MNHTAIAFSRATVQIRRRIMHTLALYRRQRTRLDTCRRLGIQCARYRCRSALIRDTLNRHLPRHLSVTNLQKIVDTNLLGRLYTFAIHLNSASIYRLCSKATRLKKACSPKPLVYPYPFCLHAMMVASKP